MSLVTKKYQTECAGDFVLSEKEAEHFRRFSAENYILQSNFGLIPFDLWHEKTKNKEDPFDGMPEEEALAARRKFRKLKKILAAIHEVPYKRVSFSGVLRNFWISRTNSYLRDKAGL